jgi:hypothetical protein
MVDGDSIASLDACNTECRRLKESFQFDAQEIL